MMNNFKLISIILLTTYLLAACEDPEKNKLDNRVKEYWGFKINKDYINAYKFLSPGWKQAESEQSYIKRMMHSKVNWLGIKDTNKKCSKKTLCTVKATITYEYQFRGAVNDLISVDPVVTEDWIMKDNVWYLVPIKKKLSKR